MLKKLWTTVWRASSYPFIIVLGLGGLGGIVFWGGLHTAMDATNSIEFCTSCHEMGQVYEEYKKSAHYQNNSGVRAGCPDCHVPRPWFPMIKRKIQATNELYHKFIDPSIDTPEKFEARRLHLAKNVWASMKASDSRECRNCHSFDAMAFDKQHEKASKQMKKAMDEGGTCIDCHKGIAHKMPDMAAASKQAFELLKKNASKTDYSSGHLTTLGTSNIYLAADDKKAAGRILPATEIEALGTEGDRVQVKVTGWSQQGAEKVIYALKGHRIFNAALSKGAIARVERGDTESVEATGQNWTRVSFTGFMDRKNMTRDADAIWSYNAELYENSCSVCHNAPDVGHFMANQWIGVLKSMIRYTALTKDEERMLQKYLQLNASDTGGAHH